MFRSANVFSCLLFERKCFELRLKPPSGNVCVCACACVSVCVYACLCYVCVRVCVWMLVSVCLHVCLVLPYVTVCCLCLYYPHRGEELGLEVTESITAL